MLESDRTLAQIASAEALINSRTRHALRFSSTTIVVLRSSVRMICATQSASSGSHGPSESKPLRLTLFFLLVSVISPNIAAAQYRFDHWTADNGLPQNSVRDIVQTRDGYLWLATLDGLVRFDGVRFTVFNKSNSPGIINNRFLQLYEDGQGDLWASTESGALSRLHDGRFTTYPKEDIAPKGIVPFLGGDGQEHLLLASDGAMLRWMDDHFQPVVTTGKPAELDLLQHLAFIKVQGKLHFGIGPRRSLSWAESDDFLGAPMQDHQGRIWFGSRAGLYVEADGQLTRSLVLGKELAERPTWMVGGRQPVQALTSSVDGSLWLTDIETQQRQLVAQLPPESRGAADAREPELFAAYGDREGNLWLGTLHNGLYRLRKQVVTNYGSTHGLPKGEIYPIYEDRDGIVWIGTTGGLFRYQNGVVTQSSPSTDVSINSIYQDRAGHIWTNGRERSVEGSARGIAEEVLPPEMGNCWTMYQDLDGALWFGTDRGVMRYKDGARTTFTTKDGLAGDDTKVIIGDVAGGLWLGSYGGLTRFKDGHFTAWTEANGLPGNTVRALKQDTDGTLWIGTYDSGLGRFKDGKFTRYTTQSGLFDNGVFQILEDDFGWVWMSCNRGIYRVRREELNDFAAGKISTVSSVAFGKSDGMDNVECNGGRWPAGIKARDGKLWFPTMGGVAVIDPSSVTTNAQPPPVVIEAARIDNQLVTTELLNSALRNSSVALQLAPRQNNFEIQYTALSFINAENLKFKYKLEGQDPDWIEAGTRRTAYYSYLPPGDYTFRVIAANRDGVWNTTGQSLRIRVLPAFYRTWWFLILVVLALSGAVFALFRYRINQLEQRQLAQQAFAHQLIDSQEAERQRIAAELHDSLGQHLLVIRNRAALGERAVDDPVQSKTQFDEITASATQAISEVRVISHNLRPVNLDRLGLSATIEEMVEKVAASSGIQFSADIEALENGWLTKEQEVNCFRIIQESLNNIVKHAQATKAYVELWSEDGALLLTVRDNGCGYDVGSVGQRGLGLTSISERVRILGGTQTVTTGPGSGTMMELSIPVGQDPPQRRGGR